MELKVISPEGTNIYKISWLELNTKIGNFIVQPGHTPMIVSLALDKEVVFCLENGVQEKFTPNTGIAEITRTSVRLLLNQMTS